MESVFNGLTKLMKAAGTNNKQAILKAYENDDKFKAVMKFIYDPYIRTNIARAKLAKAAHTDKTVSLDSFLGYFSTTRTGNATDVNVARAFMNNFIGDPDWEAIAAGIVTKTLKTGVTAKTLNKVYGDTFIPLIGIMKGVDYFDNQSKVKGPYIATEKIDGIRRLLVKENGVITMYSRSGIPDDGLVDIIKEAEHLPDNCVYDGELAAKGEFDNAIALRQATASIANRKGDRTGLEFRLFDMIPLADYKNGKSINTAVIRKIMLGAMFGDPSIECLAPNKYREFIADYKIDFDFKNIVVVPIEGVALTHEDAMRLARPIWLRGFEGIMLNTMNGLYDITKDRSRDLLKVKHVEEHVLTVIDVEEGKAGTKNEGRLGALVVDYNGERVGVGSGLDDNMRNKWWSNPSLIIGKKIEVETFGESTNAQGGTSLNCPIFKRVVGAE